MIILVTGGCGFVGCSIVPLLLENGYQVKILDLLLLQRELIQFILAGFLGELIL